MKENQPEINKAFVNLTSIKNNLPDTHDIHEKYVNLYHSELDRLIKLGFTDLEEFKIPEEEVKKRMVNFNLMTGGNKEYSNDRFIERSLFLIKLDAVLAFFGIISSKTEIGFKMDQ